MSENFSLIETLLWENGDYFLPELHLKRLKNSADYFSYKLDSGSLDKILADLSVSLKSTEQYKIRLLLDKNGSIDYSYDILDPLPMPPLKISFSEKKTDKKDIFYYHKTTCRDLYDNAFKTAREKGFFDVIFTNQKGHITEGAITNVVIFDNSKYYTPPLSCGVLDGVFRRHLLTTGTIPLEEKIIYKEDLLSAEKIYLINSVRKMVPVTLDQR